MSTSTNPSSVESALASKPELNSILSQVQNLQTDREKLMRQLEFANQKVEKLTEGKRVEMKQCLEQQIAKWLEESVENEANRKNFMQGLERLVKDTARHRVSELVRTEEGLLCLARGRVGMVSVGQGMTRVISGLDSRIP